MPSSTPPPVDYDSVAPTYDSRYRFRDLTGTGRALLRLAGRLHAARVLEAGCGTGHWLAKLAAARPEAALAGLDLSGGMLEQAQQRLSQPEPGSPAAGRGEVRAGLVRARAADPPFAAAAFDLIFCVNAIHHFRRPQAFVAAARRLLAPGGALFVVLMDPHSGVDRWTVYDYFPRARQIDLERMPPAAELRAWMRRAGLERVRTRPVERIQRLYTGQAVFADPILGRLGTSQLALLSDAEYDAGIARMRAEIERPGEPPRFETDITLWGTVGYVKT